MEENELTKEACKLMEPLVGDDIPPYTGRKAAFAVARAYRSGYFRVPVKQLTDDDLLSIRGFGPCMLKEFREVIKKS